MMSLTVKATIYPITGVTPHRVAIVARPRGGDWLCDELSALSREGIDVLVSMLADEESTELGLDRESDDCEAAAITFVNLPIPDRSVPTESVLVRLGWDATEAFDAVEAARGCAIPDTPEQRQWVMRNIPRRSNP